MVLVTGASGAVGRAVLQQVQNSGQPVKAMYRKAKDAATAPHGVPTVIADFADPQSLRPALSGVESVFLVCSPVPDLVQLESNVIDICLETGVRHVVLNSALGAQDYPTSFPSWHRKVEDHLKASGLAFTIFRPNGFMQNIVDYNAPSIRAQDAFYSAMGPAPTSFLDIADIAAVTAQALTSPDAYAGKTYELNGPEAVSSADLAERISRVAGRTIQYVEIPEPDQERSMLALGMPQWQVTALLELQRYYTGGQGGEVTDVLSTLLGRAPRALNQFLEEVKDSFKPEAPTA